jgi:ribosome-binding protein aMBF1 (putative translation factor)
MLSAFYNSEAAMDQKDFDAKKTEGSERLLEALEKDLADLAKRGELDFPINEQTMEYFRRLGEQKDVPAEVTERFLQTARRALVERRLAMAGSGLPRAFYTLGRLIQEIRTRAALTARDVAQNLGEKDSLVVDIEAGTVDPLTLQAVFLADLMILFSLPISTLEKALRVSVTRRDHGDALGAALGRIPRGTEKKGALEAAQEDLTYHLANKKGVEASLPTDFLERIQVEVRKKGRQDLLAKASE